MVPLRYFNLKPQFYFFDDVKRTACHIILPANAPLHHIVSVPQSSLESASNKRCILEVGALSPVLLLGQDNEESSLDFFDSDCDNEENYYPEIWLLCESSTPGGCKQNET